MLCALTCYPTTAPVGAPRGLGRGRPCGRPLGAGPCSPDRGMEGACTGTLIRSSPKPVSSGVRLFSQRLPGIPRPPDCVICRSGAAERARGCVVPALSQRGWPRDVRTRQERHKSTRSPALASLLGPPGRECGVGAGPWGGVSLGSVVLRAVNPNLLPDGPMETGALRQGWEWPEEVWVEGTGVAAGTAGRMLLRTGPGFVYSGPLVLQTLVGDAHRGRCPGKGGADVGPGLTEASS